MRVCGQRQTWQMGTGKVHHRHTSPALSYTAHKVEQDVARINREAFVHGRLVVLGAALHLRCTGQERPVQQREDVNVPVRHAAKVTPAILKRNLPYCLTNYNQY